MQLLITGICGFVGSTLAEALLDHAGGQSLVITGIDNFSRAGSWLNRERLIARGVRLVHGDIRNASDLEGVGPFDWVIDAAANPSVLAGVGGQSSSRQLVEHNLFGTIHLLEACKSWRAGFILLSTSRVYSIPPLASLRVEVHDRAYRPRFGRLVADGAGSDASGASVPGIGPDGIGESFTTAAPVSLYGATKLASETLALEYGSAFDFPVWINRCGVMAGARQFGKPDQGIFAFWIHSWREQRPLKYIGFDGLGHQVRDCLHPRDLAPLVMRQISSGIRAAGSPNVVNVSGGAASAMSLRQLSDWCRDRFPGSATAASLPPAVEPAAVGSRPFDLPWVVLDPALAAGTWGWQAVTPVHDILDEIASFAAAHPDWIETSRG